MMTPVIQAQAISCSFTVRIGMFGSSRLLHAVDDVSYTLHEGESLGLVGESGCGKSTLGRVSCGLLRPDSGKILLNGKDLPPATARSWARGRIQMVFQDPASSLDPRMKVARSIAEPLLAAGHSKPEALRKAANLMEIVGLQGLDDQYPHQFSGGQRQRIAVARALASRPQAIICDEPVSALDASVQAQILNLLRSVQKDFNPAYLFISHSLAVVGFMCARLMVMYLGQLVEWGSREELFSHAAHPYTLALLENMPAGEKEWAREKGELPPPLSGELPSPINPPSGCYFHPRCPKCQDICRHVPPPWRQMGENWQARCHFPQ